MEKLTPTQYFDLVAQRSETSEITHPLTGEEYRTVYASPSVVSEIRRSSFTGLLPFPFIIDLASIEKFFVSRKPLYKRFKQFLIISSDRSGKILLLNKESKSVAKKESIIAPEEWFVEEGIEDDHTDVFLRVNALEVYRWNKLFRKRDPSQTKNLQYIGGSTHQL